MSDNGKLDEATKAAIGQVAAQLASTILKVSLRPDDSAFAMGLAVKMILTHATQDEPVMTEDMMDKIYDGLQAAFHAGLQQHVHAVERDDLGGELATFEGVSRPPVH